MVNERCLFCAFKGTKDSRMDFWLGLRDGLSTLVELKWPLVDIGRDYRSVMGMLSGFGRLIASIKPSWGS